MPISRMAIAAMAGCGVLACLDASAQTMTRRQHCQILLMATETALQARAHGIASPWQVLAPPTAAESSGERAAVRALMQNAISTVYAQPSNDLQTAFGAVAGSGCHGLD